MVKEVGMGDFPLQEGYVGNLTDDQEKKLKEMWQKFFECCEKATGSKSGGEGGGGDDDDYEENSDPKKSGIPKGDAAKEEAKKKEEEQAMNDLLKEYGKDSLRDTFWRFVKFDDPDTIMLRFLRARKWDVTRAVAMLAGCLKWRLDTQIEEYVKGGDLKNGSEVEKFLDQQRSGKTYALGAALNEQPICYIHVRKHFTYGQPGKSMQTYVIYAMESFRLLMMPPNDKVTLLFDLTGFGLRNMDWSCILFILKCLEAYFPESLGILYIHNAPWIFSGIWKFLGPLLDPVVRAKVKFTKGPQDMTDRIPAERLITGLSGNMTNEFTFIEPKEGENDLLKDSEMAKSTYDHYMELATEYEKVTHEWAGKGSSSEKRQILVKKLRVAQFEMEPYTRGKTQTHRDGTLDGQGIVTWLYKQKDGDNIRHIVGRQHCVAVCKREIKEAEDGGKIADAVKKSEKALEEEDWVTLYGSEEEARKIEGPRVDGKIPEEGTISKQTQEAGFVSDDAGLKLAEGGAAAGGGGATAAASGGGSGGDNKPQTFSDAPEADAKETKKAVDGDAKVDEKADTAQGGGAEGINAQNGHVEPINGDAQVNGNGNTNEKSKSNGAANAMQEKKQVAKEKAGNTGSKIKNFLSKAAK